MFPMDAGNDDYDVFLRTDCSVIEKSDGIAPYSRRLGNVCHMHL